MRTTAMAMLAVAALAVSWTRAQAHVAPAVNANNRYLKLTPMRDRARVAYTIYIGEVPGAQARSRMDRNRDGVLDDSETRPYGEELAAGVLRDLHITWDGAPYTLSWSEIHMGMGMPVTDAGSFSVDLIGWVCGQDRDAHSLVMRDRFRVPLPGETEVRVQQSPGITVTRSTLGQDTPGSQLAYEWQGPGGPMARRGLYLDYEVDTQTAMPAPGDACQAGAPARDRSRGPATAVAIAAAVLTLLALASLRWWKKRQAPANKG